MGDDVRRPTTTTSPTPPAGGRLEPIPTPMRLQWRRARYQVFPAIVFLASLGLTGYLWKNYNGTPHGLGEVAAMTIRVAAPRDGRLLSEGNYPQVYDHVTANQTIARFEVSNLVTQEEKAQEEVSQLQKQLDKVNAQLEASSATGSAPDPRADELRRQAAALREAVAAARGRLIDLTDRIKTATVSAPVSGKVTAVSRRPDEFVKQGEEILTITPDAGAYIISYVRPESAIVPKKNQKVVVRNHNRRKSAVTTVQEVGTRVEPIPDHQLVNTKKPEWGIPVRIAMPDAAQFPLMPGELVLLTFDPAEVK